MERDAAPLTPGGPAGPGGAPAPVAGPRGARISLSPPLAVPAHVRLPSTSPPAGASPPRGLVAASPPMGAPDSPRGLQGRRLEESVDATRGVLLDAVHQIKQRAASLSLSQQRYRGDGLCDEDAAGMVPGDPATGSLPYQEHPHGGVRHGWQQRGREPSGSPQNPAQLAQRLMAQLDEGGRPQLEGAPSYEGEGSPGRMLRALLERDWEAAGSHLDGMGEQQDALIELCESLCRSELGSHWKLLRLRKALALVPKLSNENRVLHEELLRARAASPPDIQSALHKIEVERRVALEQHTLRKTEESTMKQKLRESLTALRSGEFPDAELITYVSTALDCALGIVFRVEDERSRLQDDVVEARQDRDALKDAAQATEHDLRAALADAEHAQAEAEKERAAAAEELGATKGALQTEKQRHAETKDILMETKKVAEVLKDEGLKYKREARRLQKDLDASAEEIRGFEARVGKMNERHEAELAAIHKRHHAQLDAAQEDLQRAREDLTRTVERWQGKLEEEFARVNAMEGKWKESEEAKLATQRELKASELARSNVEQELAHVEQKVEKHAAQIATLEEALAEEKAALAKSDAECKEAAARLAHVEAARDETQKLLSAAIESAEVERIFNEKNVAEKNRLAEELVQAEEERDEAREQGQTLRKAADAAAEREANLRRELDAADQAKQTAFQSLEELGAKAAKMKALFEQAVEDANGRAADARAARDREHADVERLTADAARLGTELETAKATIEEQGARVKELEAAEEILREGKAAKREAGEQADAARERVEAMERALQEEREAAREQEDQLKTGTDQAIASAQEQVKQYEQCLADEAARNERAEERVHAAVEQLRVLERQRLGEYEAYRDREAELKALAAQLEERLQAMTQKYNDTKFSRHAQKNAKSVGWILAGRGSLLRDIYRLHTVLSGIPNHPHRQVLAAKELSCHILGTHLFECERRHLGMPPSETILASIVAEQNGDDASPKHPSPRQSMRLLNHSPAATRQDAPNAADYAAPRTPPVSPPPLPPPVRPADYLAPF